MARLVAWAQDEDLSQLHTDAACFWLRLIWAAREKIAIKEHTRLPKHVVGRWPTGCVTLIASACKVLSLLTG